MATKSELEDDNKYLKKELAEARKAFCQMKNEATLFQLQDENKGLKETVGSFNKLIKRIR